MMLLEYYSCVWGGGLLDIYLYSITGCPEKEVKVKEEKK